MLPIAAVTDCCEFSGLKHENVLSYNPRGKRSELGLTELKTKVSPGPHSFRRLEDRTCPLTFPASMAGGCLLSSQAAA